MNSNLAPLLTSKSFEWFTPEEVLERVRRIDTIGLDPCTVSSNPVRANWFYTIKEDGLVQPWTNPRVDLGLVFVNPPYGKQIKRWIAKMVYEAEQGAEIVALIPARTDTVYFHDLIFSTCDALLFWRGRLTFINGNTGLEESTATFPSLVAYWGPRRDDFCRAFSDAGVLV